MGSPLNRLPRGLLEYLGIKAGGWGPRELSQVLQPVLELRDWYLNADALEVVATLPAAGVFAATVAAGTIALTNTTTVDLVVAGNVTVPQDETWLILEASCAWTFSANAGQSTDFWWGFRGVQMPSANVVGWNVSDAAIARSGGRALMRPIWSRPGDVLTLSHGGIIVPAGTVSSFQNRLRLVRFKT